MKRTIKGDITKIKADVIVNAANNTLLGGGGVDGAIHMAAGPLLLEECKNIGSCPTGEIKITEAYNLKAKKIFHAVGPIWDHGKKDERALLKSVYRKSLETAYKMGFKSIVFPNISTGVYNYPKREAAEIAISTTHEFLQEIGDALEVIFVCHDEINYFIYKEICPRYNPEDYS